MRVLLGQDEAWPVLTVDPGADYNLVDLPDRLYKEYIRRRDLLAKTEDEIVIWAIANGHEDDVDALAANWRERESAKAREERG